MDKERNNTEDVSIETKETQPVNRAQRRAMKKQQKKTQRKYNKMLMNYIKRHPEAIKFDIDEDKIAELETEAANIQYETEREEKGIKNAKGQRVLMKSIEDKKAEEVKKDIDIKNKLSPVAKESVEVLKKQDN